MFRRMLSVALMLCCLTGCFAALAEQDAEEQIVISADGFQVTYDELSRAVYLHMFQASLNCASLGYGYDMVDPLNIEDSADKTVFDLEMNWVVKVLARENGVELTQEDQAWIDQAARDQWRKYREIADSDNGMAFLPAGDYQPSDDAEETLDRYFASFGLTMDALTGQFAAQRLDEKLYQNYTAHLDGTQDELIVTYADWVISHFDTLIHFEEDQESIRWICMDLEYSTPDGLGADGLGPDEDESEEEAY